MKYSSTSLLITVLVVLGALCGVLIWHQSGDVPSGQTTVAERAATGTTVAESAPDGEETPREAVALPAPQEQGREAAVKSLPDQDVDERPELTPMPDQEQNAAGDDPEGVDIPDITADADDVLAEELTPDGKRVITGTVAKGDTAAVLLNNWLPSREVYSLLEATRNIYSLSKIREGQPYTLVFDPQKGMMESFEYEIDSDQKLIILSDGDSYSAKLEDIEYQTRLVKVDGSITTNLFQAMTDAGETPGLVMIIASIYAWEINFIKDIREGDSFSILVEKRYRDGEFRKYGRVLGASFTNQKKTYEAFRFTDGQGHYRFFTAKGESLEKTLLKAPLAFTRVTSGYSMNRLHPIFNTRRPHQGIDYGAPSGTPIMAVGSGTVTKVGWVGGYGKQVVVRHSGKLESMYSHMSRYAKGIKVGSKVRQGQVIGYVGATGNATGPHLDFRLKQNGAFINPGKAINPRVDDLPKKSMAAFAVQVQLVRDYLEGRKDLSEHTPIQ